MGRKARKNGVNDFLSVRKEIGVLVDRLLKLTSIYPASIDLSKSWASHIEICDILNKITSLELSFFNVIPNGRLDSKIINIFIEWLQKNKVKFDGITIKEFKGYDLGLMATKKLFKHSVILVVPDKVMMTVLNADESLELKPFIDIDILLRNMPNIKLAMFLLLEKFNPDSFWKPYIDMLPDKYSTVLYFTPNELKELKPSPVYDEAMKLQRNIARQYAYFYNEIHSKDIPVFKKLKKIFTYDNYRWAVSTVMTRQNKIRVGNNDIIGFIPLWDMCNHEEGQITTDYLLNSCECRALRDFEPEEQIFIYYGNRCNAELFLYNGFVYPENKNDDLSIALGISANDLYRNLKISILQKLGLFGIPYFKLYPTKNAISVELLAFIRVFVMEKEELEQLSRINMPVELVSFGVLSNKVGGLDIDIRAHEFLRTRCQLLLASYKCLKHEWYDSDDMPQHKKNINMLKECEEKILKYVITHLEKKIQDLKTASQHPIYGETVTPKSVEPKGSVEPKETQDSVEEEKFKMEANKSVEIIELEEPIQSKEVNPQTDEESEKSLKPEELQESSTSIEPEKWRDLDGSLESQETEGKKFQKRNKKKGRRTKHYLKVRS